jgi:hypothetical protein
MSGSAAVGCERAGGGGPAGSGVVEKPVGRVAGGAAVVGGATVVGGGEVVAVVDDVVEVVVGVGFGFGFGFGFAFAPLVPGEDAADGVEAVVLAGRLSWVPRRTPAGVVAQATRASADAASAAATRPRTARAAGRPRTAGRGC